MKKKTRKRREPTKRNSPPAKDLVRCMPRRSEATVVGAAPAVDWAEMVRSVVLAIDADHHLSFANRRFAAWIGLPYDAIASQHLEQLVGPAAYQALLAPLRTAMSGRKAHFSGLLSLKGGSWRMVEAHLTPRRGATGIEAIVVIDDDTERWLVAAALKEREARLSEILHQAADGIVTIDSAGHIESFNAAAERIFGFKAEEIVGESINRLMPMPDAAAHDGYVARYLNTGKGKIIGIGPRRVTGLRKDGSLVPLDLAVSEAKPGGKRIFTGIMRDVTEQVRVERALADSEARFRAFAESASDWFWEQDSELRFTYVSEGFMARWPGMAAMAIGRRREEMAGAEFDTDALATHLATLAAHKPFRNFRYRMRGRDQSVRIISISGVPQLDATGRFLGYRGAGRDVTEEVEIELHARRAHRRLAAALAVLPESFALFDATGMRVLENESYRAMLASFGASIATPDGTHRWPCDHGCRACTEPAPCAAERALLQRLGENGEFDSAIELEDSTGRWLHLQKHRLTQGDVALVALDISELKVRQAVLEGARQAAEAANTAKSAFLAHMSHELRTPLNAIIGFAEVLMRQIFGPIENPRYREYAGDIHRSGTHLLELINQLLDLAKIEAGKLELNEEEFDLADVAREAAALMRVQLAAKRLEMEVRAEKEAILRADRRAVKQSIINLMSNALKFTDPGGRVDLRIRHRDDGGISLTVADTGIGIPADKIDLAFKPFAQIGGRYERAAAGTGLGLAITRSLIELHGGRVAISSRIGEGTTVELIFPPERVTRSFGQAACRC